MISARRDVFQGIADPTRREILGMIAQKPMNLNTISEQFDMSRPAISQHIKILSECRLIRIQKKGRERICEPEPEKLHEIAEWIEPFKKLWTNRFNALDDLLDKMKNNPQ